MDGNELQVPLAPRDSRLSSALRALREPRDSLRPQDRQGTLSPGPWHGMLQAGFAKDRQIAGGAATGSHRPCAHRARGRKVLGLFAMMKRMVTLSPRICWLLHRGRMARGPADRYASRCYRACEAGRSALLLFASHNDGYLTLGTDQPGCPSFGHSPA